jgi:hypothetical protein
MVAKVKKDARKGFREGRAEALNSIETFLDSKGIKHERVMEFVCFTYKGTEHRARQVLEAQSLMGYFN